MKKIIHLLLKYCPYVILLGLVLEIVSYLKYGFLSFTFVTPIVFYLSLWLSIRFAIVLFYGKNKIESRYNLETINASVFFSFIIIECVFRAFGIFSTYSEKRSMEYRSMYENDNTDFYINGRIGATVLSSGTEYLFKRSSNNEGFSDKKWVIEKCDSCCRIIAIGDSFTEGDGADQDSTWVKFLERKINKSNFECFNAGICGSDPIFGYYNLENRLIKYKPDLVILCVNPSDIDDIIIRGGFERFQNNQIVFRKGPWWEIIYASSHLSRVFYSLLYDNTLLPKWKTELVKKQSLDIIQNCLLKFKTFCAKNNCQFICVFHPFAFDVSINKNLFDNSMSFCKENAIVYIDLFEYYQNRKVKSNIYQYYWEIDGHHKARGYELMADGIFEGLKSDSVI